MGIFLKIVQLSVALAAFLLILVEESGSEESTEEICTKNAHWEVKKDIFCAYNCADFKSHEEKLCYWIDDEGCFCNEGYYLKDDIGPRVKNGTCVQGKECPDYPIDEDDS